MGENAPRVRRTGGSRRSPAVAQQLKARQERRNALRAAEKERRKRIDDAERMFTVAFEAIEQAKQDTVDGVEELERQIEAVREREKVFIAEQQRKQALAAVAVRAEVSNVDDVAEELQISAAATRQLLKMGRPEDKVSVTPKPPRAVESQGKPDPHATPRSDPTAGAHRTTPVLHPRAPQPSDVPGSALTARPPVFGSGAKQEG